MSIHAGGAHVRAPTCSPQCTRSEDVDIDIDIDIDVENDTCIDADIDTDIDVLRVLTFRKKRIRWQEGKGALAKYY